MTAIDRVPDPFELTLPLPTVPVTRRTDQFERMANWLDLFMRTAEVAKVLARTAFVPDPMRGQPEDIAAAMMRALELGIDPLDGLANLHVIKGRVGYSAEFMRRRILEAGHELVIDESTDDRCKVRGRRAGSQEWQTASFTADQARKAKINLGDYPADKLVARASSRLCRRVFPDVLAGATILDDVIDVDGEVVADTPSAAVQRKRQPKRIQDRKAVEPEPPPQAPADVDDLLDEPDVKQIVDADVAQAIADHDEPVTKPQLQKLSILRQQEGYPDTDEGRAEWFEMVETIIGRLVASNKELTKAEASVLIDALAPQGE